MTLLYFEGFDVHTKITGHGDFIVADTDAWWNWRSGTFDYWRPEFYEGYLGGGAMRHREVLSAANEAHPSNLPRHRVGFWATAKVEPQGLKVAYWIIRWTDSVGNTLGLRANIDGSLVAVQNSFSNEISVPTTAGTITSDDQDWHYYEFFVDTVADTFQVRRDGFLIVDVNIPVPMSSLVGFQFGQLTGGLPFPYWNFVVDHLWTTDGDPLPDREIIAVSTNVAQDSYTSFGRGFRATMMIAGERYETDWRASTTSSTQQFDHNICTVVPYFWMNYPVDGSEWTQSKYNTIQSWGVCFAPNDVPVPPGGEARVDSLVLSRLVYNGGRPLVLYDSPGNIAQFSGTWRKSNPELSYFAHVNDHPREDILDRDDSKSLYTGVVGCILFGTAPTPNPDDPDSAPIDTFGITFAEEFREDYRDFFRVDGLGTDYLSYAVAGYGILGDSHKQFQSNYVTVNAEEITNGGAYVQGLWDYTIDRDTGRWSMKQQVYRLDHEGHRHFSSKLRFRGHGKAFQLRLESQSGKPFSINGWAVFVTANTSV